MSGETAKEEARRAAIIEQWGDKPPQLEVGQSLPMATGYVLVIDGTHTVERDGRSYFVGIDPEHGWVQTSAEVGTVLGG